MKQERWLRIVEVDESPDGPRGVGCTENATNSRCQHDVTAAIIAQKIRRDGCSDCRLYRDLGWSPVRARACLMTSSLHLQLTAGVDRKGN